MRGASSRPARSVLASSTRASSVAIWEAAPSCALAPALRVGGDGGEPAAGNLRFARERLRFRAHLGEPRALAFDLAAHGGEPGLDLGGRRQRGERVARLRCGRRRPRRGSRSIASSPRRARRAAPRCGSPRVRPRHGDRAPTSASCCSVAPASAGRGLGLGGGCDLGLRPRSLLPAWSRPRARTACSSASMSARRFLPARRRAAPVGALAATEKPSQRQRSPSRETSRWPGLSSGVEARRILARDDADLRQPARQLLRRLDVARRALRRPSGSAGSVGSMAAPAQRIGADGSIGASRSSPSAAPSAAS